MADGTSWSGTLSEKSSLRCLVIVVGEKVEITGVKRSGRRQVAPEWGLPTGVDAEWYGNVIGGRDTPHFTPKKRRAKQSGHTLKS